MANGLTYDFVSAVPSGPAPTLAALARLTKTVVSGPAQCGLSGPAQWSNVGRARWPSSRPACSAHLR